MTRQNPPRPKGPITCLVTTGVVEDSPVFADPVCCDILLRTIARCQQSYGFEVLAYAILPEHFRSILHLGRGRTSISDVMRELKKQSAREIMTYLEKEHSYETLRVFSQNVRKSDNQRRRFWRPHYSEIAIGDLETLRERITEIHDQVVRRGLAGQATEYRYSSAGLHLQGDHPLLPVTAISELDWIV